MTKILSFLIVTSLAFGCQNKIQSDLVAPVKFEGKFGFIDTEGNWVIEPTFDSVGVFYNGFATVYQNEKEGKIDTSGELIIDSKYDFIGSFEDGLALVFIGDSINYVRINGDLISTTFYYDGEDFSTGLAPVQFEENGRWGYINSSAELVLDTIYQYAEEFKENEATVTVVDTITTTDQGNPNIKYLEVIETDYLIDLRGTILDTLEYERRSRMFELIGNANSFRLGKVNSQGDTIMTRNYRAFGYHQGDVFWFFTGYKYGLADTTGTILIEPIFDYLTYFSDNGLALAKKGEKYGFIDRTGNTVIPFKFENANGFKYDLAAVKLNEKWGFIDRDGEFAIEPKFENVTHCFRPTSAKNEAQYNFERE